MSDWDTVIGLEVHAQLKTHSKLFSSAPTGVGAAANTQTHWIDAGYPGVLPVLNQQAVHMAIAFGLAIDATLQDLSYFERKHYWYPDLPKGYQTSQMRRPIVVNGQLLVRAQHQPPQYVTIERAHLEEDAGKSLSHGAYTGIDLNRAGMPLMEIVTTPCLFSAKEAVIYLKTLHQLLIFLNICDGNMQDGSFRCDVNVSIKPKSSSVLGTKVELKNLNSFRFIEKAIGYEQLRQRNLLESGQLVMQETRLYCEKTQTTRAMRQKEQQHEYRYMPDPDLLPIQITPNDVQTVQSKLPMLPEAIRTRLIEQDHCSDDDIDFLLSSPHLFEFYDQVKQQSQAPVNRILIWLKGPYLTTVREQGCSFDAPPISATTLAASLDQLTTHHISMHHAKRVFPELVRHPQQLNRIISSLVNKNTDDEAFIHEAIQRILTEYPQQVLDYRAGKQKLLSFFIGRVLHSMPDSADPAIVQSLLQQHLKRSF